eukprot:scaffold781_cov394-Prasinococcus_capsulatus_cf.AAC.17
MRVLPAPPWRWRGPARLACVSAPCVQDGGGLAATAEEADARSLGGEGGRHRASAWGSESAGPASPWRRDVLRPLRG